MNPQQQKNGQQPLPKQEVKAATAEAPKLKDGLKEIVIRRCPDDPRMFEILKRGIRDGKPYEEREGRPVDHKGVAAGRFTTVLSGGGL